MKKKSIAVGNSSFITLIEGSRCYVDKTAAFQPLIESGTLVDLITRPQGFGKTLFLDSLNCFLAIDMENPGSTAKQHQHFKGLKVAENQDFCRKYMGQVPVLALSLKGVDGATFEDAYRALVQIIAEAAQAHAYLLKSPRLTEENKKLLRKYQSLDFMRDPGNIDYASGFLRNMLFFLAKHFDRQAMLFLDDYDVPLARAVSHGYYTEMSDFCRAFLDILKPEAGPLVNHRPVLQKALLTGCLCGSKEGILPGINNVVVNTVSSNNMYLSSSMGFTEPEVRALLDYYGLSSRLEDVRHWYGGYCFGSSEIFCPQDLLNFCEKALASADPRDFKPGNFRLDSSSSRCDVIDEFLSFLTERDAERMQTLIDGGSIEIRINQELRHSDINRHLSEDFWTLLLFTGCLAIAKPVGDRKYLLRIPNEEIRDTFRNRVQARFSIENRSFAAHGLKLAEAAAWGNASGMADVLAPLLRIYVSLRDTAAIAPAENCCHDFLSALFACASNRINDFQSNAESGDGCADIVFSSGNNPNRFGVVIEIRRAAHPEDMLNAVDNALKQIDERKYAECLRRMRCRKYYAYGIVFCGKECEVGGGKLREID